MHYFCTPDFKENVLYIYYKNEKKVTHYCNTLLEEIVKFINIKLG